MGKIVRKAELLGALSRALDLTEGQPEGHCVRCCWIGMSIGRKLHLPDEILQDLYYTLLLKDLGCSSNAARICALYLADDLSFKRDFKLLDGKLPEVLRFVLAKVGAGSDLATRFRATVNILKNGGRIVTELIETRCQRGADIARQLRFSQEVCNAFSISMSTGTGPADRRQSMDRTSRYCPESRCSRRLLTYLRQRRAGRLP